MAVYVPLDDVRAMLQLVAEAREIVDGGECAQAHVLAGVSRLAGAAVGIWFRAHSLCPPAPLKVMGYLDHGWTDGERRRAMDFYTGSSGVEDPVVSGLLKGRCQEREVTVRRSDVVASRAWYASTLHNELHRPVGTDDVMVSVRFPEGAGDGVSVLVLKRAARARPFSVEEREIVHLLRRESDWVFRAARQSGPPPHLVDGLTRREQDTLGLLLTDASEKVMAARLGISPHTLHHHVKKLYRKLGVSSRAALMKRALSDDPQAARP
jgi:DNA-binding CsgD family transcriptional regulator